MLYTQSELMSVYNKAKAHNVFGDLKRTHRALGYLMQKDQSWREKYHPTTRSCNCEDHCLGKFICKHMRAIMIETRIEQSKLKERVTIVTGVLMKMTGNDVMCAEQLQGSYNLHTFPDDDAFKAWVATHSHGTIVRPANAKGSRGHTIDHGFYGEEL